MKKIAVLIRVYDRIEDLKYNLRIITDTWKLSNYYIIVVSNGYSKGYVIDDESLSLIDKLVVLDKNAGHRKGNSQLLMEGVTFIPEDCDCTIILEADTWIYKDELIKKYREKMNASKDLVWASADWYDKQYGLATDFAIIKSDYIKANPKLFDFDLYPECYISNFLRDTNSNYVWITENMPVHIPSYVPKYPYVNNSKEKRFYVFPKSQIVTHHIEFLKHGMVQKKRYFNIVTQTNFFEEATVACPKWELFKMRFWIHFSQLFIKKSWFSKKKYKEIKE